MTTMTQAALSRARVEGSRQDDQIVTRLRKATGQLSGVTGMVENGRYCIEVLDQLCAVTAAIDAVAVLVLSDHINSCVRAAIESGDAEEKVGELVATFHGASTGTSVPVRRDYSARPRPEPERIARADRFRNCWLSSVTTANCSVIMVVP